VELAISSVVLLLLLGGVLDFGRVFYFQVTLHNAAREGARHGAWYDAANRYTPYLDDADIISAVNSALAPAGLQSSQTSSAGCPSSLDGNPLHNPPYGAGYYPTALNKPVIYTCYFPPCASECLVPPAPVGNLAGAPQDNSWRQGDLNVIVLQSYGLASGFMQNVLGNGIRVASYSHMTIQGRP
jgi:hypothetical protein